MKPTEMDEMDLEIAQLLGSNGRMSNLEIARRTGISEGSVRNRIHRLISKGIMTVVAVVIPEKIGLEIQVLMGIETDLSHTVEIGKQLGQDKNVRRVVVVTGEYDLIVEAAFHSGDEFLRYMTDKLGSVTGIRRTRTFTILKQVKYPHEWIPEK